jgi:hypothetical protein
MDTVSKYRELQNVMQDYSAWVASSAWHVLAFLDVTKKRVVDLGCGQGDWLKIARDKGATEILGVESFALGRKDFSIPIMNFDLTAPLILDTIFDIALCLEVGEHLSEKFAEILVTSLVNAAPLILFSAAVPGQGGIHHVNEQPPAYWHKLFQNHGYRCFDFRHKIWDISEIEPWYRMGVLIYAAPYFDVGNLEVYAVSSPLHLIHPDIFTAYAPRDKDIILHYDRHLGKWYPEILA